MLVYIYCLVDPRNYNIRYVGQSIDPYNRLNGHINPKEKNKHKRNWIKQLIKLELQPIVEVFEECTEKTWSDREKYWVAYCKSIGCKLVNKTEGGEGLLGYRFTKEQKNRLSERNKNRYKDPEQRRKLSEIIKIRWENIEFRKMMKERMKGKNNPMYGKSGKLSPAYGTKHTEEWKILMRKPKSEEHKRKIGDAHKGMHHSEEAKRKMSDIAKKRYAKNKSIVNIVQKDGVPII